MLDLAQNGFGIICDRSVAQVQIGDRNNVAGNGIGEISVAKLGLMYPATILQWLLVRRSCRVGRLRKAVVLGDFQKLAMVGEQRI